MAATSLPKPDDVHIEKKHVKDAADELDFEAATLGSGEEHSLTFWQACKIYPSGIFWAAAMAMTIIMEGYDGSLMNSFFAYPSFVQKYGVWDAEEHKYVISSAWMAGLGNAAACGSVIGLLFNGYITERFGHRRVISFYLSAMAPLILVVFFAPTIGVLCAGQVLLGVTWGGMAVLGTAYASEVCPLALRGHLTAMINVFWIIGQFVSAGVLDGLVNNKTEWSFRIPFAIQWIWIIPLLVLTAFAPESPWWLVRKGRLEDAEKSLRRLSRLPPEKIQAQIQLIVRTDVLERQARTGTSFFDCFRGTNLRRTEIAAMSLAMQTLDGAVFAYQPVYFFTQAGISSTNSFKLQLGSSGLALVCTFVAFILLERLGRRTLLIAGLSFIAIDLLVIGVLATIKSHSVLWAQAAFAVAWIGFYSALIGPESFCMAAEVSATRLRATTLSIARNSFVIVKVIETVIEPYLINPTAANLKGKTAFFWLGTTFLTLLWAIFRIPETRGRTYEELDRLFERKIPAWKFSKTNLTDLDSSDESVE